MRTLTARTALFAGLLLSPLGCDVFNPAIGGKGQPCSQKNTCMEGYTCTDKVCVANPDDPSNPATCKTCESLGKTCGSWPDDCGKTLTCGTCGTNQTCSAAGQCICDVDGHFDPAQTCATCLGNWDLAQGCNACKNHWVDSGGNNCGTCPGNWDVAQNCNVCLAHWVDSGGNNCGTCPGNWDPAQSCNVCKYHWTDSGNNCGTCPGNWDSTQDCNGCKAGWDPAQGCAVCSPEYTGVSCNACASGTFGVYPQCFLPSAATCLTSQCYVVPPTNQAKCYNATVETACPGTGGAPNCGSTAFCGQDAQYPDNPRTFTCYSAGGSPQSPCDGTADANEVVTDSLTGLMWQRTFVAGKTWQQALDSCDTLTYAGFTDWRLPSPFELQGIVDDGRSSPSIDTSPFQGTLNTAGFWTSAANAGTADYAWYVYFNIGNIDTVGNTIASYVRCVRLGPSLPATGSGSRYVLSGTTQKVVLDVVTGLTWQKDTVSGKTWQQALAYCEGLSYGGSTDWRLPNKKELVSLINYAASSPASDFPEMPAQIFWSSTTNAIDFIPAWYVDFNDGSVYRNGKSTVAYTRCVRLGP